MELVEPDVGGHIVNRYEVQSMYMDYPIEVVVSKSSRRMSSVHIRTIPPGMNDTQFEYYSDVMLKERITRAIKESPLWYTIVLRCTDMDKVHNMADYAAEVYYDIFRHEA
jgi:hypothetical protein